VYVFFFGGGGEGCSYHVPNYVPQVPNVFPKGVPNNTAILSHVICLKFSATYIGGPQGRHHIFTYIEMRQMDEMMLRVTMSFTICNFLFWRAFKSCSLFFSLVFLVVVMGQSKWLIAGKKNKRNLGGTPTIYEGR